MSIRFEIPVKLREQEALPKEGDILGIMEIPLPLWTRVMVGFFGHFVIPTETTDTDGNQRQGVSVIHLTWTKRWEVAYVGILRLRVKVIQDPFRPGLKVQTMEAV